MKDFVDAISSRISSPYFGYALLSFIAINWQELFLLFLSGSEPRVRITEFEESTSFPSLVLYPLLVGAALAILTPWSRWVFDVISREPTRLRNELRLVSEHNLTIRQAELEEARAKLSGQRERELIDRARRDEEVAAIEDNEVKEQLASDIEKLRVERDQLKNQIAIGRSTATLDSLGRAAVELMEAAAKTKDGSILAPKTMGRRRVQVAQETFGGQSPREFAKYEAALEELEKQGYVKPAGSKREIFELTNKGWKFVESL